MTRQLATMVSTGLTILRSLYVLESQTKSNLLRDTLASVRQDVEAGLLFSAALERHPKVFNSLYVAMVKAGESGGVLETSLMRTADQLEKDAALRRQIRAATIYPSLVISFAFIVLLALVAFLIPVFKSVFAQFGGHLPALTQFMVNFSDLITHQWYILLAVIALAIGVHLLQTLEAGKGAVGRGQASVRSRSATSSRRLRSRAGRARFRRSPPRASRSWRRWRSRARPPATR